MKLPNNYGSVTKLSGNRRKPFMARINNGTVLDEKRNEYVPNRVVLGYYATGKDALNALAEYNNNPFDISKNGITFSEIYNLIKSKYSEKLSVSTISAKEAAFKHCEHLHNMKIRDIKANMLQDVIDSCEQGSSTKKHIRTVMHSIFEYASKNDFINKDYSSFIRIEQSEPVIEREIYTDNEIKVLWSKSDRWDIRVLLILLYSGMRVNELLKNTNENVNLDEQWIYVPKELSKNKSSIRYVPIHDKVLPLFKDFYNMNGKTIVVNENGFTVPYNNFVSRNLKKINKEMDTNHKFHDTRHTFISKGHEYKLDELCLKKIVGHSPDNITQKVYTHITNEELLREINKIK